MSVPRTWRPALLVAAAACLVNAGALAPGFIHDDHRIIEQNELVQSVARWPEIVSRGYWSVGAADLPILYRPVTIASFALNAAIARLDPLPFRIVNLALHAFVALMVLWLGRRLASRSGNGISVAPLAAALLFAVHPIHTEVLGEVVGRAELLAAAGTLVSLLAFLRWRETPAAPGCGRRLWLPALAVAAFGCGFLAKENAVAAPFVVLLADLLLVRRPPAWRFHAAMGAMLAACLLARAAALGGLNPPEQIHLIDNPIAFAPWLDGRLTALAVLSRYAGLLVLPLRQSIDYSFNAIPIVARATDPAALGGAALIALLIAGFARTRRREPAVAFALAFMALAFLPVANLLAPIGTIMAERLLYLPSVGACFLGGIGLDRLARRRGPAGGGRRAAAILAPVLVLLAARSALRLRDWRDDYSIFRSAVAVVPTSVRALYNYGAACEDRGEDRDAEAVYGRAVAIWPDFADAHYNLAGVLTRRHAWGEAADHYRTALALQPRNVKYMVNLGHALNAQGKPGEARPMLRQAVDLDPDSAEGWTNLGAAELALGDAAAAVSAYTAATRLDAASADYQRNLALAQVEAGDAAGAEASYRRALERRPGDPDLLAGLGMARLRAGDLPGGLDALRQAAQARPSNPIYPYQLGKGLEQARRFDEAAAAYRESARLSPSSPVPLRALGLLLFRTGDRDGAAQALERAAALDPQGKVMDDEARRALAASRARPAPSRR